MEGLLTPPRRVSEMQVQRRRAAKHQGRACRGDTCGGLCTARGLNTGRLCPDF